MDNVTLTTGQLHELIGFIRKRGFNEPLVIVEILDHFACKVEEKLKLSPGISLQAAITAAHDDFGTMGFVPIVKAYEANIRKKYVGIYRHQFRMNLANPVYVITALVISLLFYKGCYWAESNNYKHILDINDTILAVTLCFFASLVFLSYKFQLRARRNPIIRLLLNTDAWIAVFLGFNPINHFRYGTTGFDIFTTIYASACFYLVMRHFAVYAALKKGYADSAVVYDYLGTVHE